MVALGVWSLAVKAPETTQEQNRIVALEAQVKQLQARTDSALSLIHEVLEDERRQRRLEQLEAQLADIPDALEELQEQVDRTVFILIGRADRLHRELNRTDLAINDYNRVIELFPNNQGAEIARQRLSEIKDKRI
jgi:tetratricopeptide (TPR) repeat protein